MDTFAERIIYLREKVLGLKQEEFAERIGVTRGAVGNWDLGGGIKQKNLLAIVTAFPGVVTHEWLSTGRGPRPERKANVNTKFLEGTSPTISTVGGIHGIPVDASPEIDVMAGLGGGRFPVLAQRHEGIETYSAEAIRDYWRLPPWLLRNWSNAQPSEIACFPCQGDSMSPTIENEDIVFVDLRHRVPSPPGIYALSDQYGSVVMKRLEVISRPADEYVQIKVSSDNPKHETAVRTLDEISIIGRYLGRFTAR